MSDKSDPIEVPRIEVRGLQYGVFVLDLVNNLLGASPNSAKGARVVAIDRNGEERVIEECANKREANRAAETLRAELAEVGARTWSKDRGLPRFLW
jgi:hypothetical protein